VLYWGIPAVLIGAPLVALWRDVRILAVAGASLPLFVLFYSQGKQIGYTGYLMPGMIMYFTGALSLAINVPVLLFHERIRRIARVNIAIAVLILSVVQVPTSMGDGFEWTRGLDLLQVSRGAAMQIVGRNAVVGVTSAGAWYTSGGQYVWDAFYALVAANRQNIDIGSYLRPIDAISIDENWWKSRPKFAPVSTWYLNHILHLKGFVLPTAPVNIYNTLLFVSAIKKPIVGYFVGRHKVMKFSEAANGQTTFNVMACPGFIDLSSLKTAFYKMSFAYRSQPKSTAPQIVMVGITGDGNSISMAASKWNCHIRDSIQGTLTEVSRERLREAGSEFNNTPMTFYQSRDKALRAAGRNASDNR
jgi:hypothetical protein